MRRWTLSLLLITCAATPVSLAADRPATSREALVTAIQDYRRSLERFRELVEAGVAQAGREAAHRKDLLARGLISRQEWAESNRALADARRKLADARRQILEADHTLAEALADPRVLERDPAGTPTLVRYRGAGHWTLAEVPRIEAFFARRFGRPLPVSAYGQTALHDRFGFDHREAVDVAVTPDSAEGTALMAYLRDAGISFLGFRARVPGEATGAHIHIGEASHRL